MKPSVWELWKDHVDEEPEGWAMSYEQFKIEYFKKQRLDEAIANKLVSSDDNPSKDRERYSVGCSVYSEHGRVLVSKRTKKVPVN